MLRSYNLLLLLRNEFLQYNLGSCNNETKASDIKVMNVSKVWSLGFTTTQINSDQS